MNPIQFYLAKLLIKQIAKVTKLDEKYNDFKNTVVEVEQAFADDVTNRGLEYGLKQAGERIKNEINTFLNVTPNDDVQAKVEIKPHETVENDFTIQASVENNKTNEWCATPKFHISEQNIRENKVIDILYQNGFFHTMIALLPMGFKKGIGLNDELFQETSQMKDYDVEGVGKKRISETLTELFQHIGKTVLYQIFPSLEKKSSETTIHVENAEITKVTIDNEVYENLNDIKTNETKLKNKDIKMKL